jgi:hypothetical protein
MVVVHEYQPGQMVDTSTPGFSKEPQPGDTGIVHSNYGYHVMYLSPGREEWKINIHDVLAEQAYDAYLRICRHYPYEMNSWPAVCSVRANRTRCHHVLPPSGARFRISGACILPLRN